MKKPEYTKPFDLGHARAGAPFVCANGGEVEILKWDRKHTFCIVGLDMQDASVRRWRADGSYNEGFNVFDLVMLPLGFIDGKPVFVGDELIDNDTGDTTTAFPTWGGMNADLWSWPAPAPVYPETLMVNDELGIAFTSKCDAPVQGWRRVANAALRHAIDAGQVVPDAEHSKLLAIIGAAYQVAGAHGASEAVLDMLSDPAAATAAQIDAMLPYETPFDRDAARDQDVARAVFSGVIQFLKDDKRIDAAAYLERAFSINLPAIIAGVPK